jgi:hypothetical protein
LEIEKRLGYVMIDTDASTYKWDFYKDEIDKLKVENKQLDLETKEKIK